MVEMEMWLDREFGRDGHGKSSATAIGVDATAYHFQSLDHAARFLAPFPALALAIPVDRPATRGPLTYRWLAKGAGYRL
ncbi:hypothetical protein ACOI1H_07265 [Loktanella sp. DJP18]|uniref:hypothetical protein n=1 Tax=Loktanella sp. DJP18 TaxID=3409788 RepID=UPI003BB743FA